MRTARGPRFLLGSVYNARRKLFVPAELWRAFFTTIIRPIARAVTN